MWKKAEREELKPNGDFRVPAVNNQLKYPNMVTPRHLLPPSHRQPFPMFGPRGATIPPKFFNNSKSGYINLSFFCDSCDKGFKSQDILNQHLSEHQKCGIEGCQFIAHPNIITNHIQMQHASGIFKKISKLTTPEEITNWIAERKRKYPTKQNIDLKKAAENEKILRGEKLNINKQGRHFDKSADNNGTSHKNVQYKSNFKRKSYKDYNKHRSHHKTHKNKRKKDNTNTFPGHEFFTDNLSKSNEDDNFGSLTRFKGTYEISKLDLEFEATEVKHDEKDAINDNDWDVYNKNNKVDQSPLLCGALANLKNCYGSSDEDSPAEFDNIKENSDTKHTVITDNSFMVGGKQSNFNGRVISNELLIRKNNNSIVENKRLDKSLTNDISCNKTSNEGSLCNRNLISNDSVRSTINDDDDACPMEVKIDRKGPNDFQIEQSEDESSARGKSEKTENESLKRGNKISNKMSLTMNHPVNKVGRNNFLRKKLPSTLLEKLLHKEIIHERNVILQCVRFIRKNNYLD